MAVKAEPAPISEQEAVYHPQVQRQLETIERAMKDTVTGIQNVLLPMFFPDVRDGADVQRIMQEQPERARHLIELARHMKAATAKAQFVEQQQMAAQRAARDRAAAEWDRKAVSMVPGANDPEQLAQLQRENKQTVLSYGVSEAEYYALMRGDAAADGRDHRFQLMVTDLTRYKRALKATANMKARPLPKVLRPGSKFEIPTGTEHDELAARGNFESNPTAKSAAALLVAKRNARERRELDPRAARRGSEGPRKLASQGQGGGRPARPDPGGRAQRRSGGTRGRIGGNQQLDSGHVAVTAAGDA
jgi:hypothetical protein